LRIFPLRHVLISIALHLFMSFFALPRTRLSLDHSNQFHTADKYYPWRDSLSCSDKIASEPGDLQMPVVVDQTPVCGLPTNARRRRAVVEPPSSHRYPFSTDLAAYAAYRHPVASVHHASCPRAVRLSVHSESVVPLQH
jgi:hypothetical protein